MKLTRLDKYQGHLYKSVPVYQKFRQSYGLMDAR